MANGADGDRAAEIAQITFVKAFECWDVIRVPRAWIRRVAINELTAARHAARRETPQATLPDSPALASPTLAVELTEEARQVLSCHGVDHRWLRRHRDRPRIGSQPGISEAELRQGP